MMGDAGCSILTPQQVDHFLERSYVVIKGAIAPEVTEAWVRRAFDRLGYDRHDPSTWAEPRTHLSVRQLIDASDFAPRAWDVACALSGGAERIERWNIGDGFIVTLKPVGNAPWQPPSATAPGWHKDGGNFRHFLDSPEQGLLALVCWTAVEHQGGGTYVACDSVGVVARYLAEHPEGIVPNDMPFKQWIGECRDFEEMLAEPGDIVLLHPFTLHATSQNVRGLPRIITNPPLRLHEPMNFNRERVEDFSLIERAVLQGLGVDRLDFRITGQRGHVESEGEKQRQRLLDAELRREKG